MEMDNNLTQLIENAKLDILIYDVHQRDFMEYKNRVLNCYVVSYVKEGSCRLRIFNRDYYAEAGDVVLIPPNIIHDHVKDTHEPTIFMWWHFNFKIAGMLDVLSMFNFPVCFKLPDAKRFEEIFSTYVRCSKKPANISDILLKESKALEMLAMILESAISISGTGYCSGLNYSFINILTDIIKNPHKKRFLKELGDKYHLHPTYISNNFKKLFGVTPIELQLEIRLNNAKKLLLTENHAVSEVAKIVGYEDCDDFTRFFKTKTGMTPLMFRNQSIKIPGSDKDFTKPYER